jgi:hypothetical protein
MNDNPQRTFRHDACCYYLLCHLAKLLQKIVASHVAKRHQVCRRQLSSVLDKPAFSRIPLNSEPRIVVNVWKIREKAGLSKRVS